MTLPLPDTLGIAGPFAAVRALHIFFAAFHVMCIATALGLAVVIAARLFLTDRSSIPMPIVSRIIRFYPLILVLGIASSALPELLGQALAGNIEFAASIWMSGWWLLGTLASATALVLVAISMYRDTSSQRRLIFVGIALSLIIREAVAMSHMTLTQRLDCWVGVSEALSWRPIAAWALVIVKFAQVLSLALAMAGIAISWFARRGSAPDAMTRLGHRITTINAASFAVLWIAEFLLMGPAPDALLQSPPFVWHIIAAIAAWGTAGAAIIGIMRPYNPVWIIAATAFMVLTVLGMQAANDGTALKLLLDHAQLTLPPVRTQSVMMAIFFAGLAAAIGSGVFAFVKLNSTPSA